MAEDLTKTYENVEKQIKEELDSTQKSLKKNLIIKIVALVIIIGYMSFLTYMVSQVNAKGAMEAVLASVNNPETRKDIITKLNNSAETNVDDMYKQLNANIPQIRAELEKLIFEKIKVFSGTVEKEFNAALNDYIKAKIEETNIAKKDSPPEEKLSILMGNLQNDFKTIAFAFSTEMTKEASQDLVKLNKDLQKLQAGKNLTQHEKYQRNLISIWVKLLNIQMKEAEKEIAPPVETK